MVPRGRVYRHPPGRGMPDLPMAGIAGGLMSMPYDMGAMPVRESPLSQPVPIGALASALANASPDQQRTVCSLYVFLFFVMKELDTWVGINWFKLF